MKKLTSLLLALVLCLSLAVPALADGQEVFFTYPNDGFESTHTDTKTNWSYDSKSATLTLTGLNCNMFSLSYVSIEPTLVLSPGSKNVAKCFDLSSLNGESNYTTCIKGSGELILSDPTATENGVFYGDCENVKFLDGLTMTGGMKEGDNLKLTFKKFPGNYPLYKLMAGDKPATYVRIAPAAGAKPAETPKPSSTGFTDVPASSPYAEAIKWAVDQKITAGKTATAFGPGDTCTDSHILTFLWRANGRPGDGGNEREAVTAWAQGLGMDTSDLSAPCTRAMAVACMWKAAGSPAAAKAAVFADVPAGSDYAGAVSWAVEQGVTKGTGGDAFSPGGTCTRGQIVTFLYRASK